MHHKTFQAISKKVHDAAVRAVTENLNQAKAVTKQVVDGTDLAVMYDRNKAIKAITESARLSPWTPACA